MFENKHEPLAPMSVYLLRIGSFFLIGLAIVAGSIGIGMVGFHLLEELDWLNAFENSAMILSTMGPVHAFNSYAGKLFASFYALFGGLIFVTTMGVMFAPIIHRFLHKLHNENN